MYGYIYLTINKVNHKTYVGQKMLKNKNWDKDGYLGSGKHLKCAIKKYGKENFEKFLIQFCYSKEELDKQEVFWITEYRRRGLAQYNIANGGQGGSKPMSEETKRKMSEAHKGKGKGKLFSEETRRKMSEAHKGKKTSDEVKRKISEAHKGIRPSEETRKKLSETHKGKSPWIKGKHHSEEARRKISEARKGKSGPNKGKVFSEETRRKMSEARKGKPSPNKGKKIKK